MQQCLEALLAELEEEKWKHDTECARVACVSVLKLLLWALSADLAAAPAAAAAAGGGLACLSMSAAYLHKEHGLTKMDTLFYVDTHSPLEF